MKEGRSKDKRKEGKKEKRDRRNAVLFSMLKNQHQSDFLLFKYSGLCLPPSEATISVKATDLSKFVSHEV